MTPTTTATRTRTRTRTRTSSGTSRRGSGGSGRGGSGPGRGGSSSGGDDGNEPRRRGRVDPRIARRRTEVTREAGRRRLRVVLAGLIGTAVIVGIWLVLTQTPIFGARAVTVVGATHETGAQVVAAAGLANHPPLLNLNTASAARGVEQLPWVRSASVSVHWPDGVKIVVHEEVPRLVMAESGNRYAEISTDGRVLATSALRPAGLLAFGGPALPGPVGSSLGAKDDIGLAVASTLPASFSGQVTGVTVEPGGWVQLALTTPVVVDIGSDTQLQAKYEDVSAILAGAALHDGDIIDVSVPDAPTVTGP